VLESVAPPALHADRFLPPTPLRIVVDAGGKEVEVDPAPDALAEAAEQLGGADHAVGVAGNAADDAHQDEVVRTALERFGGLDLLVNNTGINPVYGPLLDTPLDAARKMFRAELDRIPDADGPGRARVFLRFATIDTNFDGQAALFAQACAADARICDRDKMQEATEREVKARFVAPGNVMPLYFVGHPRLAGPQ